MNRKILILVGGFAGIAALGAFVNTFFMGLLPLVGCLGMCAIPMLMGGKKNGHCQSCGESHKEEEHKDRLKGQHEGKT